MSSQPARGQRAGRVGGRAVAGAVGIRDRRERVTVPHRVQVPMRVLGPRESPCAD